MDSVATASAEAKGPRVLVMGDSFVMAENVPLEQHLRAAAHEWIEEERTSRPAVEGVNAGRSGYGPDQSLLLLERRAR